MLTKWVKRGIAPVLLIALGALAARSIDVVLRSFQETRVAAWPGEDFSLEAWCARSRFGYDLQLRVLRHGREVARSTVESSLELRSECENRHHGVAALSEVELDDQGEYVRFKRLGRSERLPTPLGTGAWVLLEDYNTTPQLYCLTDREGGAFAAKGELLVEVSAELDRAKSKSVVTDNWGQERAKAILSLLEREEVGELTRPQATELLISLLNVSNARDGRPAKGPQ